MRSQKAWNLRQSAFALLDRLPFKTTTWVGISHERIKHISNRFYRTDRARSRDTGGTGLGLAIVRAIAEAHGGHVTAASEGIGQGSTFAIELPLDLSYDKSSIS